MKENLIMENEKCDLILPNGVKEKRFEEIDGYIVKYHARKSTIWSRGKVENGQPAGYWEWFRQDGTIKRSVDFENVEPIGEWKTYNT